MPICLAAYEFFETHLQQNPYNYLEIGSFDGSGVCGLAKKFPEKKFYTVDPFVEDGYTTHLSHMPATYRLFEQRYVFCKNATGLDNIIHFEMPSFCFLEEMKKNQDKIKQMNIGTVFIDGSHHSTDVLIDCEVANLVLKKGHIIFDDDSIPTVHEVINNFREKYKHRIVSEQIIKNDVIIFSVKE